LPKRWIVERTFAWLARYRRHSPKTSEPSLFYGGLNSKKLENPRKK
jgi:transposase